MARSSVEETLGKEQKYYHALGFFLDTFAYIEVITFALVARFGGISEPIAKAILSGARIKECMDMIRRIFEVTNPPQFVRDDFEIAFKQLNIITNARNDIVHYGMISTGRAMYVTNAEKALTPDRRRKFPVSSKILADMTADLFKIQFCLMAYLFRDDYPKGVQKNVFGEPWRYIPPAPKPKNRKTPKKPRKPKLRLVASQESK